MPAIQNNFFLNLEQDAEEEQSASLKLKTVFQGEMNVMSKDNSDYVKRLREQIAKIDRLKGASNAEE